MKEEKEKRKEERRMCMGKVRCAECGNNSGNWKYYKSIREYKGNGYFFELEVETPYCEKCGSPVYDKEVEKEIREKANAKIREQTSIITKEEILELLNRYNVSQKYLSKVLGWGEATLPRYIKGSYSPGVDNSNKLKSIKNPYILLNMINQNIDDDDDSLREKLIRNVNHQIQLQEESKGKIFKVVDWFLNNTSEEEGITHLALQKALYFVQSWNYVFNNTWMFPEECEAWVHGAVFRDVYDDFKTFRYMQLPRLNTETSLAEQEIRVLEFVKKNYLDIYSAKMLEQICHLEEPFKNTRGTLKENERSEHVISKETIAKYYSKISEKYDIDVNSMSNIRMYLNELLFA